MKQLHKIGKFYTKIMIKNIGIFIFIGLLSVVTGDHGWFPNEDIYAISQLVYKVILPCLIAYTAGNAVEENGGGVLAVLALSGILAAGNEIGMLGAMIIGPAAGLVWKNENRMIKEKIASSVQMLVRNLSLAVTGILLATAVFFLVLPALSITTDVIGTGLEFLAAHGMIPFMSIVIEPAKIFFMNNIINHSILVPIAMGQLDKAGSSVLFLLEANPGPGLGILAALCFVKRERKSEYLSAIVAEAAGGIHEVYFPYILSDMRLIFPLILGATAGNFLFEYLNVGVGGDISPGSIFVVLLMAGKSNVLGVLAGVLLSAGISFVGGVLVLRMENKEKEEDGQRECAPQVEKMERIEKIAFVCDGGVGSSAMGAALFRRTLGRAGITGITVEAFAADMIPDDIDLIVCQKGFRSLLPKHLEETKVHTLENLVSAEEYGHLVELIQKRNG